MNTQLNEKSKKIRLRGRIIKKSTDKIGASFILVLGLRVGQELEVTEGEKVLENHRSNSGEPKI